MGVQIPHLLSVWVFSYLLALNVEIKVFKTSISLFFSVIEAPKNVHSTFRVPENTIEPTEAFRNTEDYKHHRKPNDYIERHNPNIIGTVYDMVDESNKKSHKFPPGFVAASKAAATIFQNATRELFN